MRTCNQLATQWEQWQHIVDLLFRELLLQPDEAIADTLSECCNIAIAQRNRSN